MDTRITALRSTTFQGRRLTRRQIAAVQETVLSFPGLSRRELAHTICEQLRWYTAKGDNRIQAVLRMLEELDRLGVLSLPAKDLSYVRGARKPVTWGSRTDAPAAIEGDLEALLPIRLQVVSDAEDIGEWNEYVARYHYMGFRHPIGPHLRYFLLDRDGRKLGCLLFSHGSRQLPCRDEWIGWPEGYRKHLDRVVGNNRFLLFPWVRVGNLASKALSIATGRLADDWEERHGFRPVLVETFADTSRSDGTCYRAANWVDLGETRGGKGKAPKRVYVYPLATDFREVLLHGPQRSAPRRSPRRPRLAPDDPFVLLWRDLIGALTAVAAEHDRVWQVRRRVLHTLLVMLFVYRLVLSSGEQGYATTLAELWEQCRALGVALPQPDPVAASAMCRARAKVDENVFRSVHAEILKRASSPPAWRGHRLFAIDGSKLNLPRPLIRCGYRTPSDTSHYPQGLLSCLVQLPERIPVAFDLRAHGNERRAALDLLPALSPGDVVIYDRGYFSWELLAVHLEQNMHPVFRIQKSASPIMDAFLAGSRTDAVVEAMPGEKLLRKLRKRHPQALAEPVRLRLVKYTAGGSTIGLATTLLDSARQRTRRSVRIALGHRRDVQDLQVHHGNRAVPCQNRARCPTGTLRPLQPHGHDAHLHNSWRRDAQRPQADPVRNRSHRKLQELPRRRRAKPRSPAAEARRHRRRGDQSGPRLRRHRAAEATPGSKLRTTIPQTPQPVARQAQESIDSLNHRTPKRSPNRLSGLRILK